MIDEVKTLDERSRNVIEIIENKIGSEIPKIEVVNWNSFGLSIDENAVSCLGLYNQPLREVPDELFKLDLKILSLVNNGLMTIPNKFDGFVNLVELYIGGNSLQTIPESICRIPNLKVLYILEDNLRELPHFDELFEHLTELSISSKIMEKFPGHIKDKVTETCRIFFNNELITEEKTD